jgi:hypothetical protein
MATLRGEPVDRPAVNFYEIGGFAVDPSDADPFNVYNDPSWQPLLGLAEEQTDLIRMRSPVKVRSHYVGPAAETSSINDARRKFFKIEDYTEKGCCFTRTVLKIAGQTMTSLTRRDPQIDTVWTLEHLLKNLDDLKAFLELPDEVFNEEIHINNLLEEDEKIAERGIVMIDTEDPICAAASLFSMEDFTIIALTEQRLFHSLLEKLSRHIYGRTEKTSETFPCHLWRIYGPEYVCEPYLPPYLFKEYVVRYTGPMVRIIHKYDGFARIHCHGKLRAILDYITEMGADAIDPVEPSPGGDVEIEYVRSKYGGNLVLFGNIETADIENTEPRQFEKIVEKALRDGTSGRGRGFVLMPTSAPNGRTITPRVMKNYETMVHLAAKFNL